MNDLEDLARRIGLDPGVAAADDDPVGFWIDYIRRCVREGQYCGLQVAADVARARGQEALADELTDLSRRVPLERSTPLPQVIAEVQSELKA